MSLGAPGLSERNDEFVRELYMRHFKQFKVCFTELVAIYGEFDRLGGQDYTLEEEVEENV